jgi:hypothetical protein
MRSIIVRDDDTSYFTRVEQLEAIYGRIWDAGYSVFLSVIPAQYGDIRVYWREGNPFDPGVPPQYRGQNHKYSILDNPELCQFLREKSEKGLVEIGLHGYNHTFYEFTTHDIDIIRYKLNLGMEILETAFPNIPIRTFISPYDRISPLALTEILERGLNICNHSTNLPPLPHLPQITGHNMAQLKPQQRLYTCDEYLFTHQIDPIESLQNARDRLADNELVIIANHYWMFYHDWQDRANPDIMDSWYALLDSILADKSVQIVPFAQND